MRSVITRAALTPACLSLCGIALGFVSPSLQQPCHRSSRPRQSPSPGLARTTSAVVPLNTPLSLALPLLASWPIWWSRKTDDTPPPGAEGLTLGEMPSPSDDRHHPSSIRNRDVILQELSKWEGGSGSGEMLDIASGTGCHVEAFAKALPGWTFQPSEVRQTYCPYCRTS